MKNYRLFLLKLENNKRFVYPANKNTTKEELQHDCSIIYEFIKENPIIEIEETILFETILDINYYVKKYMMLYGIDNVRGGSYSDMTIPSFMLRTIEHELDLRLETIEDDRAILTSIKEEYNDIVIMRKKLMDAMEIINRIKKEIQTIVLQEPEKLSNKYDAYIKTLTKFNNLDQLTPDVFDDLRWLSEKIGNSKEISINTSDNNRYTQRSINTPDKNRYKQIMEYLPSIYSLYCSIRDDPEECLLSDKPFDPVIYLKNPNVGLDLFFYHIHKNTTTTTNWNELENKAKSLIAHFEYMAYVVKNRKDEFEFDLSTYPRNFTKRYFMSLDYIKQANTKN